MASNLYVHFPFCRRKCCYCALHSRVDVSVARREAYVRSVVRTIEANADLDDRLDTVYFGGGSPALCDLRPIFAALARKCRFEPGEFTVELHPEDVTSDLLSTLKDGGVNRISVGVQSLDDAVLADMGRGYDFAFAERAFAQVRERFDNCGIDLIVGYPGEDRALSPRHARLAKWGLSHCSVYSLILEEKSLLAHRLRRDTSLLLPDDDTVMNRLGIVADFMHGIGLERYEISNYAVPGKECRHNQSVWRGEDYVGIGEGAFGRVGLRRTQNVLLGEPPWPGMLAPTEETVNEASDRKERTLFGLRTREGLDASDFPHWKEPLDRFVAEGLLTASGNSYCLTPRGTEVCDSILAELV